jgi:hypothetical protein
MKLISQQKALRYAPHESEFESMPFGRDLHSAFIWNTLEHEFFSGIHLALLDKDLKIKNRKYCSYI